MEQGWDPEVKRYFKKIILSISFGLIWLMAMANIGIYHGWAYNSDRPIVYMITFYILMVLTLGLLIAYYYRVWKK